jgi:hypothetical protein
VAREGVEAHTKSEVRKNEQDILVLFIKSIHVPENRMTATDVEKDYGTF